MNQLGKIAKENTRILITLPIKLKDQLTDLAKADERTLTNLILKIMKSYVDENTCE